MSYERFAGNQEMGFPAPIPDLPPVPQTPSLSDQAELERSANLSFVAGVVYMAGEVGLLIATIALVLATKDTPAANDPLVHRLVTTMFVLGVVNSVPAILVSSKGFAKKDHAFKQRQQISSNWGITK